MGERRKKKHVAPGMSREVKACLAAASLEDLKVAEQRKPVLAVPKTPAPDKGAGFNYGVRCPCDCVCRGAM